MAHQDAQITRDSSGQIRERNGRPDGIVRSYDERGWLLRSASYRGGRLDGEELLFGAAGRVLFGAPLALGRDLERSRIADDLRWAFEQHARALPDDAAVTIVEPEREYLIAATEQMYSLRALDGQLAVAPGRLIRRTLLHDGAITARTQYRGGRLHGERAIYGPPDAALFTLSLDFQSDLDNGALPNLQLAFRQHGQPLADDALIALELAEREWRILQSDQMFTVLRSADRLGVHPGRITQRTIFVDGQLTEHAHYQAGRLDGAVTVYRAPGAPLFEIEPALGAALDAGQLGGLPRLFQQRGHALRADAVVTAVDDDEWFIAQIGQSYTIKRAARALSVFAGRVISQASYQSGALHGPTALYDEGGLLTQQLGYCHGRLDGPMTLYAAGQPQTLITFRDGRKHGPMIAYDERGRPTMVSHYQADQLDGELRVYKEGLIQALATYRGGVQHGRSIAYHPSGAQSLVADYRDGLLDGETVLHNEVGQVVKTSQYRAGKLDGVVIEYFPSGAVRTRSHYHDDQLDGIVYLYDEQGRLQEKTHYRSGQPAGKPERRSWRQALTQR
jgi:antitoxin component YwqK of YwqJK toxin-antitoxin module